MARYARPYQHFDEPWHAHELTFSCLRRQALLSRDRTRRFFTDAVNRAKVALAFDVWA